MGNLHLVTGYAGQPHVSAADQGSFVENFIRSGEFILEAGAKFSASIVTNNQIRVNDGEMMMQGRHVKLNPGSYVDLTIENGAQGYLRNDLVVIRYTRDPDSGIEDCNLVVLKGTPSETDPADPECSTGNLNVEGALQHDFPLYRVFISGLIVEGLTVLFKPERSIYNSVLRLIGGTMEGDIEMDGHKVTGLGTPTNNGDAVPMSAMVKHVSDQLTSHNTNQKAHADIRAALQELENWVKDLLDCDDETLNETHEIVEYIKSNKSLIDAITTSKVSVKDIVNDLVTKATDKPLSAAQGAALKDLIDALKTAVEELLDVGQKHTDPAFTSTKSAPSNSAPYAEVKEIGGMTHRVNVGTEEAPEYVLRSAPVAEVESVGENMWSYGDIQVSQSKTFQLSHPLPAGTYSVGALVTSSGTDASSSVMVFQNTNGVNIGYATLERDIYDTKTITFKEDVCFIRLNAESSYENSYNDTATWERIMLNAGTAQPHRPYVRNTLPIPEAVQVLDGYGWGINESIYNYVDFEKKRFVKHVGCVDMGTLSWDYSKDYNVFLANLTNIANATKNLLCSKYSVSPTNSSTNTPDMAMYTRTSIGIGVKDATYTDAETFKSAMSGVMLYYELAEPIITDISDLLPNGAISVEGGGTVTMVNEFGYDVPNTIDFYLGKNEVIAADTFAGDLVGTASRAVCDSEGNKIDKTYLKQKDLPTAMPPTAHNQAASTITAGTFAGQVVANASGQPAGVSCVRNSQLVNAETNPTVNGEICWTLE